MRVFKWVSRLTKDNQELSQLFKEDQADRMPPEGKPIDWSKVEPETKRGRPV